MPRALLLALLALLTVACGAAFAQSGQQPRTLVGPGETGPATVQLDTDPAPERVLVRRLGRFRFEPRLEDDCANTTIRRRIGAVSDNVAIESVRALGATLLWVSGSSGASGRVGDFRLHRLGPQADVLGCPGLRTLFAFPSAGFRAGRAPRGTTVGSTNALLRRVDGRLTIRTVEGLYRAADAGCCPAFVRTTDWRYSRARDRFVKRTSRTRRT
jgi:hypothetical protein